MTNLDTSKSQVSDYTNVVSAVTVASEITDGPSGLQETEYQNSNWTKYWGYYNNVPDVKAAITMKAIWNVGKGYEAKDTKTEVILSHIRGWGKETFRDILFNMEIIRMINGDSFAEIVRDPSDGEVINIKPLDPGSIKIIVDEKGMLVRYEQVNKVAGKEVKKKFTPGKIFHLTKNRLADQIHGISDIRALETTILADEESFSDVKKLMHHQAKPFIMWKLKTDDPTTIKDIVNKIEKTRNLGEDLYIPDDDDTVSYEIVQLNPSQAVFEWRNDIRNKFYRSVGLPQIIPGAGGFSTESESKVIFRAFEQLVQHEQKYIEDQVLDQLGYRINLLHPESLLKDLQQDEAKDANQQLQLQPGELSG